MKGRRLVIVVTGISSYRVLRERSLKTVAVQQVDCRHGKIAILKLGRKETQGNMGGLVFTQGRLLEKAKATCSQLRVLTE